MKKLLAILLSAAAVAVSTAMTAFAQEELQDPPSTTPTISNIVFVKDEDVDINGGILTPGKEYRFLLQYTTATVGEKVDNAATDFTDEQLNGNKFLIESKMGRSAMDSFKITKSSGKYYLVAEPKAGYPTKQTDVEYKIRLVNTKNGDVLHEKTLAFKVGYKTISDDELYAASVEEPIFISNDAPVITEDQFEEINSYTSGKAANFTNGDWTINVRVGGLKDQNLYSTSAGIPEIETKFEESQFKFINFPANPKFDYTAKISVDVSNEADAFEDSFVLYRYKDGVLTHMPSTYNPDTSEVTFSTKEMGKFVLTNVALGNSTIVDEEVNDATGGGNSNNNNNNNNSTTEPNPDTGASVPLNLVFAAAAVSLMAGIAASKRR